MKEINSRWIKTTGTWSSDKNKYINIQKKEYEQRIRMLIIPGISSKDCVLRFIGGPTGYESYYALDLITTIESRNDKEFCICAGTINSWPACYVKREDVINFLKEKQNAKSN